MLPIPCYLLSPANAENAASDPPTIQVALAAPFGGQPWAKLPAPKTKQLVRFSVPLDVALLGSRDDSDDDEGPVRKKIRATSSKGSSATGLLGFLPPPKHSLSSTLSSRTMEMFSRGTTAEEPASHQHPNNFFGAAEDEADVEGGSGMDTAFSNEMYRADMDPQDGNWEPQAEALDSGPGFMPVDDSSAGTGQGYVQQHDTGAIFEEALLREQTKEARRRGDPGMGPQDLQFVEVNADKLKYVDPSVKESMKGVRSALGAEYEMQLRASAKPFTGNKVARRKHQIGTLYHNAKMRELDILEGKAQTMKNKAETQGKYGW